MGCVLASAAIALTNEAAHAAALPVPVPSVQTAPAGEPFATSFVDLAPLGFSEQEFFFSGTTAQGPYTSRMLVRRPVDPHRFNGTVIVEWMNASAGHDIDVDFMSALPLMQEEGYAYVGVTSQQITVNFLSTWDPDRYGTLTMAESLPAQPAAHEVFAQAGAALLANGNGVDPLGGLHAERLIAIGQSQSCGRLQTFASTVHGVTLEPVYDAFLPHACGGAPTGFPAPIIKVNSENEAPGYFGFRGVANDLYRYWEVAGSSHQPLEGYESALKLLRMVRPVFPTCPFPVSGPGGPAAADPVVRSAIAHLDQWVQSGEPAPAAPLIDMIANPANPNQGLIQRDQYGNALGGIRMPQQEVPTGRNTPSFACAVTSFPQWDAFDGGNDPAVDPTDTVNATEPSSPAAVYEDHGGYVSRFGTATKAAEDAGFILPFDAQKMRTEAASSNIAK